MSLKFPTLDDQNQIRLIRKYPLKLKHITSSTLTTSMIRLSVKVTYFPYRAVVAVRIRTLDVLVIDYLVPTPYLPRTYPLLTHLVGMY